jgi:hypothetical protein
MNGFRHSVQLLEICDGEGAGSLGFAAGRGICGPAVPTTTNAPPNPSPIACAARSFVIHITVACADFRSQQAGGGSSGLFHPGTKAVLLCGRPVPDIRSAIASKTERIGEVSMPQSS